MSNSVDLVKDSTMQEMVQAIREISGHYDLSDYKSICAAVRNGHGDIIPNGTVFQVPHAVYGNVDFVVRRKNSNSSRLVSRNSASPTLTATPTSSL